MRCFKNHFKTFVVKTSKEHWWYPPRSTLLELLTKWKRILNNRDRSCFLISTRKVCLLQVKSILRQSLVALSPYAHNGSYCLTVLFCSCLIFHIFWELGSLCSLLPFLSPSVSLSIYLSFYLSLSTMPLPLFFFSKPILIDFWGYFPHKVSIYFLTGK